MGDLGWRKYNAKLAENWHKLTIDWWVWQGGRENDLSAGDKVLGMNRKTWKMGGVAGGLVPCYYRNVLQKLKAKIMAMNFEGIDFSEKQRELMLSRGKKMIIFVVVTMVLVFCAIYSMGGTLLEIAMIAALMPFLVLSSAMLEIYARASFSPNRLTIFSFYVAQSFSTASGSAVVIWILDSELMNVYVFFGLMFGIFIVFEFLGWGAMARVFKTSSKENTSNNDRQKHLRYRELESALNRVGQDVDNLTR